MNKQIKNRLIILLVVVFDRIIYWQKNWHIKLLQSLGEDWIYLQESYKINKK